ncbi:hypothetical protein K1X76_03915 [bacterium]|nr:hypothetical protein [bacterium]
MHPSVNRLKNLLKFWMFAFLGSSIVFLFFGDRLLTTINAIGLRVAPHLGMLPMPSEHFWLTLTMSLMFTLVFLCYLGQKDILKNHVVVPPILLSKFVSTTFFMIFFLTYQKSFAYLVGVLSDGPIFLITYLFYSKAKEHLTNAQN